MGNVPSLVQFLSRSRHTRMAAHKTLKIKQKLAKKLKQNRPIPQWIRLEQTTPSGTTLRGVIGAGRSSSYKQRYSAWRKFGSRIVSWLNSGLYTVSWISVSENYVFECHEE